MKLECLNNQTISLLLGNTINFKDLDIKNITRIKAELSEIKLNCSRVIKQLNEVQ